MAAQFGRRLRKGAATTAVAAAAVAALSASQAPGVTADDHGRQTAADAQPSPDATAGDSGATGNSPYYTDLPPLNSPNPAPTDGTCHRHPGRVRGGHTRDRPRRLQEGRGRRSRESKPGCNLPWQLLAAIGKVESGQARGGRVDADGTTTSTDPRPAAQRQRLRAHPRHRQRRLRRRQRLRPAVGPMQFIPSTWAWAGRDGNGDGEKDPNNIYDAALAAGHYLCRNGRDLSDQRRPGPRDPQLQQLAGLPEHGPVVAGVLPQGHPRGPGRHRHAARTTAATAAAARAGLELLAVAAPRRRRTRRSRARRPTQSRRRRAQHPARRRPAPADDPHAPAHDSGHAHPVGGPPGGRGHREAHRHGGRRVHRADQHHAPRTPPARPSAKVRIRFTIVGDTDATFTGGEKRRHRRSPTAHGVATAPALQAGEKTGAFTVRATVVGRTVTGLDYTATVTAARRRHPRPHRRHRADLRTGRRVRRRGRGQGHLQGRRRRQGRGHRHPDQVGRRRDRERQGPLLQGRRRQDRPHPDGAHHGRQRPAEAAEALRRRHHRHLPAPHHHRGRRDARPSS